ncbi:MAG: hypothetical protein KBD14_01580 [Candidatus Pacebacteria bacterium]|nr:hypothetical protein [Candidatus Paceibacterota bacterium]
MSKKYFGFAIADSMFPGDCEVSRKSLSVAEVKELLAKGVISCCNSSHQATIVAAEKRFGLTLEVPEKAPQVSLESGDAVIVMSVRGLARLQENRHEYTDEEIASATFAFGMWTVS